MIFIVDLNCDLNQRFKSFDLNRANPGCTFLFISFLLVLSYFFPFFHSFFSCFSFSPCFSSMYELNTSHIHGINIICRLRFFCQVVVHFTMKPSWTHLTYLRYSLYRIHGKRTIARIINSTVHCSDYILSLMNFHSTLTTIGGAFC